MSGLRSIIARVFLGCALLFGGVAQPAETTPDVAKESQQQLKSLLALREQLKQTSQYQRTLTVAKEVANLTKRIYGQVSLEAANALYELAFMEIALEHYEDAEMHFKAIVAIRTKLLGTKHSKTASALNNLGMLYVTMADYDAADMFLNKALAIDLELKSSDTRGLALDYTNLGMLHYNRGDYQKAEDAYTRALKLWEDRGESSSELGAILTNLALVHFEQGDFERAEALYLRAHKIIEAVLGPDSLELAKCLTNRAALYFDKANYRQAEQLNQRALEIKERILGPHNSSVAISLNNLADDFLAQGDYPKAEQYAQRALDIYRKTLTLQNPAAASTLTTLADIYLAQGKYELSEKLFTQALQILQQRADKNPSEVIDFSQGLARVLFAKGETERALSVFERVITLSERRIRTEGLGLSENRLSRLLESLRANEEILFSILKRQPNLPKLRSLALTNVLLRKGRLVDELAVLSRLITESRSPENQTSAKQLLSLRARIANLTTASAGSAATRQLLQTLEAQAEQLEHGLAQRTVQLNERKQMPGVGKITAAVASSLKADDVLIEVIAYPEMNFLLSSKGLQPSELRYMALSLNARGEIGFADLGLASVLDPEINKLLAVLANPQADSLAQSRRVHDLLIKPLLPLIGSRRRVLLSLDGPMNLLPFAALHDGQTFLGERITLSYVTSGRDVLRKPPTLPPTGAVLVLADPAFFESTSPASRLAAVGTSVRQRGLELGPLTPLPGTRLEAKLIRVWFPQAVVMEGRDATEPALLGVVRPDLLHVATHAFFLEDATRDVFTDRRGLVLSKGPPPANPLLRSGLALAGAKLASANPPQRDSEGPDGVATALEMSGMNLWGTQLVVLSACDTGRGEVRRGHGVYGMRRAVLTAGAETLVTSLWRVNDDATHKLMGQYYERLSAGAGRVDAMQAAQKWLRESEGGRFRHPYFWASFIVIGNGGPLRQRQESSSRSLQSPVKERR